MKLKNKGYTLVELILSIAIFAIVMVGVTSIMSSTLKSYSNANIDIAVQEDCQMAANQLEEFLCDAKSISSFDGDPANGWTFVDQAGVTQTISYEDDKVTLTRGGVQYTIADHVSSFSIDNWKTSSNVTATTEKAYNQAVINMSMDNNGQSYTLRRNVYFRNDVEENSFHGISYLMGATGGGGGGGTGDIDLIVKRYETINLSADYRIRYNAKLYKKNGAAWDLVTDPNPDPVVDVDNSFFKLSKSTDSPVSGTSVYYLTTGASVNSDLDLSVPATYKIEGSRDGSDSVTIYLTVEPVDILATDVVVQHHENNTVNAEGFTSPINVKGIDINEALKSGDFSYTFKYSLLRNGSYIGNNEWTSTLTVDSSKASTDGKISAGTYQPGQYNGSFGRVEFGLAPDPFLGGFSVTGANTEMGTACSTLIGDTNLSLKFNIVMNIVTGSKTFNETFKFTGLGTGF